MKKTLIKTNKLSNDAKKSMKNRLVVAAILLVILIPCLVLGGWFYLGLVLVAIGASTYEIAKAPSRKLSWIIWAVTFVVMYALIFWVMVKTNFQTDWKNFDINTCFTSIDLSPFALAVMIGLYLFVVIIKSIDFTLIDACYLIAMTLILSLGFQAILVVRYLPFKEFTNSIDSVGFKYGQSMFLIIYLLIAIFFNDIGAYFFGVLFGKHKMAPNVSPKKTWEGFFGGMITSMILSITFALVVAYFNKPILPIFTLDHWYWVLLISIFLPAIGVLGDLSFSAIKRQFGKKDYSKLLGAHGGILDRIDSTLFGAIALVILIVLIKNNWDLLL